MQPPKARLAIMTGDCMLFCGHFIAFGMRAGSKSPLSGPPAIERRCGHLARANKKPRPLPGGELWGVSQTEGVNTGQGLTPSDTRSIGSLLTPKLCPTEAQHTLT